MSFTCTSNQTNKLRWIVHFASSIPDITVSFVDDTQPFLNATDSLGNLYSFRIISRDNPLTTTMITVATTTLDDTLVQCRDISPNSRNDNFQDVEINIIYDGKWKLTMQS